MQMLTAAEMAATDKRTAEEFGTPFGELMENAGTAVARFVQPAVPAGAPGAGRVRHGQQRWGRIWWQRVR